MATQVTAVKRYRRKTYPKRKAATAYFAARKAGHPPAEAAKIANLDLRKT